MKLKPILLWLHRWLGLTIGLYFVLLGLTGSYLVYPDTFNRWFSPSYRFAKSEVPSFDLEKIVSVAKVQLGTENDPGRIKIADGKNPVIELSFNVPKGKERRRAVTAFVDPSDNSFLGEQPFKETLHGWIFFFHHDLFLGSAGRTVMGATGLFMLFLLVGGLYLWWPKRNFLNALRLGKMRNAFQINFELHKFSGFYSLILMLVVTFSGVYISKPNWFQFSPSPQSGPPTPPPNAKPVPLDLAQLSILINQAQRPIDLRIDTRSQAVNLVDATGERRRLSLATLELVAAEPPRGGKSMRQTQRDLHGGHFWGEVGPALVFISGFLPLFFYVTGFVIWRKKVQARKRRSQAQTSLAVQEISA